MRRNSRPAARFSLRSQMHGASARATEPLAIATVFSLLMFIRLSAGEAALALLALVATLAIYGAAMRREILIADPIVILGLAYVLAASLPFLLSGLYIDQSWTLFGGEFADVAAAWMYRGYAAMVLAYFFMTFVLSRHARAATVPDHPAVTSRFVTIIGYLGITGSLLMLLMFGGPLETFQETAFTAQASTFRQIADSLNFIGFAYVYLYRLLKARGITTVQHRYLLIAIVGIQVIFIVGAGSKATVISLLIMLLLPTGHERSAAERQSPWRQTAILAGAVTGVYFTFHVITAYREIMRTAVVLTSAGGFERFLVQAESFALALQMSVGLAPAGEAVVQTGNIFDRFAYVGSFGRVLLHTGGVPPYEAAFESFLLPLYAFLPRDLLDKPIFFGSDDLARLEGWEFGGISVTLPGSLYWAWGYTGIIAGMALIGVLLGWVVSKAHASSRANIHVHLLKALFIVILMDVGFAFQPLIVNFIRYAALAWGIYFFARHSVDRRMFEGRA